MARYQLANFNVARMRVDSIEDPLMEGFVSRLDEINAVAEQSPGFVWRLQSDDGNATSIRPYADTRLLINLTVWTSVEALEAYVYKSAHAELVREGRKWFEPQAQSTLVLWWIPEGTRPTEAEAMKRLEQLHREGPTADAFTFRHRFPPPA